jgi:hypothetical protein
MRMAGFRQKTISIEIGQNGLDGWVLRPRHNGG